MNPNGENLSLGDVPLPTAYFALSGIWALLTLVLIAVVFVRREHKTPLHILLIFVALLTLGVVLIAYVYWDTFSISGIRYGKLKYLQSFVFAISETIFFCVLLLIAKGWKITRAALPMSEIRAISVALLLLLSTLLFFSFYNDGYYFLSLMIMYFFMLPKIFASITHNTRTLQAQMLLIRHANHEADTRPLFEKVKMFRSLRLSIIIYLGSILMVSSVRIIMLWFLYWINWCLSEAVVLIMVVTVCYLLRPRPNGVFGVNIDLGAPIPGLQNFDSIEELLENQVYDREAHLANDGPRVDMNRVILIEYPNEKVADKLTRIPLACVLRSEKQ